jgi:hypothetical protein
LRTEAESLQLAQIEFVEIRRRILLGSVVVHVVRKAGWLPARLAEYLLRARKRSAVSALAWQWQEVSRGQSHVSAKWTDRTIPYGRT